jgi:hypothetical protein
MATPQPTSPLPWNSPPINTQPMHLAPSLPTWQDRPTVTPSSPPPAPPEAITYQPEQGSRLDQLLGEYERIWEEHNSRGKTLDGLKTSIKAELGRLFPGREVVVTSPSLTQPLRLYPQDKVKVDRKTIEKVYPGIWARCTTVATSWVLGRL